MRWLCAAFVTASMLCTRNCAAVEVGFSFSGLVVQSSTAFGHSIPPFSPVAGRIVYDTESPETHDLGACDCGGYRQEIFNGFSATVGGIVVRADDYVVEVTNDFQPDGGADFIRVIFSSGLGLEKPLFVGGAPYSTGLFSVLIKDAQGGAISNSALPLELALSQFESKLAILSDSDVEPQPDIVTTISVLQKLAAVSGDYDFDQDVDGMDFLRWQRTLGSNVDLAADGSHNEIVDGPDLQTWADHFGTGPAALGGGAEVPEPATVGLLVLALLFAVRGRPKLTRGRTHGKQAASKVHRRSGFTLAELLLAISIVGMLTALLLPALQSVRESARSAACQNHLRQVSLALLNYESGAKAFPTGARSNASTKAASTHGVSWWVEILPFLEQQQLFDQLDVRGANSGLALLHPTNGVRVDRLVIDLMFCPSSPLPSLWPVGAFQLGMPSYVGVAGAAGSSAFYEERTSVCCAPRDDGQLSAGGILISNRPVRRREIDDGLSNTIAVGETSDFARDLMGAEQRIDGGFPNGWLMGTRAVGTPPEYSQGPTLPSWNITTIKYQVCTREYDLPGVYNSHGPNNPLLSAHPGGAFVALADGSIQFISQHVDVIALMKMATRDEGEREARF